MYVWRQIPLLRLLVPFILGIVCYVELGWHVLPFITFLLIGFPIIIASHFYFKGHINRPWQKAASLLVLLHFFAVGFVLTWAHKQSHYPSHFNNSEGATELLVRISSHPQQKTKSISCTVELHGALDSAHHLPVSGQAQFYIQNDKHSERLKYGDYLLVANDIKTLLPPSNPHQFNFKKYYAQRNIYHQGYIKSGHWRVTGQNKSNWLLALSYKWQDYLKQKFAQFFDDEASRGVAQAIVFGYKDDLDDEWMDAFSRTGTIHVLAVSGLHVGIIYVLLSSLLMLKRSKGYVLKLKSIVVLLCLFAYCMLTGFAPSVSRASIMFGVVVVAKAFQRRSTIYNTLSFACFVLLVVQPLNLYNVGFQFSFLAVLGIVYYQKSIRKLLPASSYIGDKIASLLAVSIAAQLATFPLGLYYFHQFPNYFFISNLVVIPFITIILYIGIAFVVFVPFSDSIAQWCAHLMKIYIDFIATVVHYIQELPYAFVEHVHLTFLQMLSLYGLLILVTIAWTQKSRVAIVLATACVVLFVAADFRYQSQLPKEEVVVFDVGSDFLVGFRVGQNITFVASQGVYLDPRKIDYVVKPYMIYEHLNFDYVMIPDLLLNQAADFGPLKTIGNGLIWFQNKKLHFLDYTSQYIHAPIQSDILVCGRRKNNSYLTSVLPLLNPHKIYMHKYQMDKNIVHNIHLSTQVYENKGFLKL